LNYTHESGESTGFLKKVSRDRVSVFSSYKAVWLDEKLETVVSAREESVNNRINPFTFSIGSGYKYKPNLNFTGNVSRNYRIPAFNDLYWKPDSYSRGNATLKPESGFSVELGATEKLKSGLYRFEFSQALFASILKDMIIWLPDSYGIWSPDNKEKGKSKGIEIRAKADTKKGKALLSANAFYSFTSAKIFSSDEYDGKPMIYVPKHRANFSFDYSIERFAANFNMNYTGRRFSDNIHQMPGYLLGNLSFYYQYPLKFGNLKSEFRINNLWNTKYQVMAWYAMPLQNYQFVIALDINTIY
jgi:outer membrane receptor protein involved in Fe transport